MLCDCYRDHLTSRKALIALPRQMLDMHDPNRLGLEIPIFFHLMFLRCDQSVMFLQCKNHKSTKKAACAATYLTLFSKSKNLPDI
jgi:hypothetical protein